MHNFRPVMSGAHGADGLLRERRSATMHKFDDPAWFSPPGQCIHVWCGCVSAICSLHPLKMIERPLTLSFNAIIPACHHLSTYPYVCLAVGRCSELLISFSQLISTPFNSLWCVYVAWRKIPPSLGLLFTLIPTFRGPWCSLSLCVSGQYTISHSSPWHGTHFPITPAKRDWKAWLHGKWPPLHRSPASRQHFTLKRNLCRELL